MSKNLNSNYEFFIEMLAELVIKYYAQQKVKEVT